MNDGDQIQPGDVELLQTLLKDRSLFRRTVMEILSNHSGLPEVKWVADASEMPKGCTKASIEFDGRHFGYLYAKSGSAKNTLPKWAAWLAHWLAMEARIEELENLSTHDELTGLRNRRYFNQFLEASIAKAQTHGTQVTLMLFDIDNFKRYNDSYGHPAGDEILTAIGQLMQSVVREHDVVARIGGDEFGVIFWDAEEPRRPDSRHPKDVLEAAKRFQQAVNAHRFPKLMNPSMGRLTVSGGLASYPWDGRTPQELLELADAMALKSKRQGKNAMSFGSGAARSCEAESS